MMFLSALTNAKLNLIAGMAIGVGMAIVCKEICKQKCKLANRNTATQHETSDQLKPDKRSNFALRKGDQCRSPCILRLQPQMVVLTSFTPSPRRSQHLPEGLKVAPHSTPPHPETQALQNLLRFETARKILTLILRKELSIAEKILGDHYQDR